MLEDKYNEMLDLYLRGEMDEVEARKFESMLRFDEDKREEILFLKDTTVALAIYKRKQMKKVLQQIAKDRQAEISENTIQQVNESKKIEIKSKKIFELPQRSLYKPKSSLPYPSRILPRKSDKVEFTQPIKTEHRSSWTAGRILMIILMLIVIFAIGYFLIWG